MGKGHGQAHAPQGQETKKRKRMRQNGQACEQVRDPVPDQERGLKER